MAAVYLQRIASVDNARLQPRSKNSNYRTTPQYIRPKIRYLRPLIQYYVKCLKYTHASANNLSYDY